MQGVQVFLGVLGSSEEQIEGVNTINTPQISGNTGSIVTLVLMITLLVKLDPWSRKHR